MVKYNMRNTKAQMTIIGLFIVFIMFMLLATLMPTIVSHVNNVSSIAGIDSTTVTFTGLIPVAFVIALIGTIFMFTRPVFAG